MTKQKFLADEGMLYHFDSVYELMNDAGIHSLVCDRIAKFLIRDKWEIVLIKGIYD